MNFTTRIDIFGLFLLFVCYESIISVLRYLLKDVINILLF